MRSVFLIFATALMTLSTNSFFADIDALADNAKQPRTIMLSGTGIITAKPDMATITSGIVSNAKSARRALVENSKAMRAIIDGLKSTGIKPEDISTSHFSIRPQYQRYDRSKRGPRQIIGYRASNQISITVRKLDQLGGLIDNMISFGANTMGSIRFAIAKQKPLLDQARKRALAAALDKAKLYTKAAGVKLGRILTISEGASRTFAPRMRFQREALSRAPAPPPIAPGTQKISVRVNVSWAIE